MKNYYVVINKVDDEVTYFEKKKYAKKFINAELNFYKENEFPCEPTSEKDYQIKKVYFAEKEKLMSIEKLEEYERLLKGEM